MLPRYIDFIPIGNNTLKRLRKSFGFWWAFDWEITDDERSRWTNYSFRVDCGNTSSHNPKLKNCLSNMIVSLKDVNNAAWCKNGLFSRDKVKYRKFIQFIVIRTEWRKKKLYKNNLLTHTIESFWRYLLWTLFRFFFFYT